MLPPARRRCTSPYRLQNRYSGLDFAFRYSVICSCRTLSGAVSPRGPSPRPSLRFDSAEQVTSLCSSVLCPNHQRSGTGSSLLRTPPTPAMARTASPFWGVAPPVEFCLLAMTGLPAYPSVTSRHVAHADPAGPLSKPTTVGPGSDSSAFTHIRGVRLPVVLFRGSFMWFICSLRPAGSTPCLLPTPPRGDAVGTVCGAEPSNCTDGTFTRVDARFTGALTFASFLAHVWKRGVLCNYLDDMAFCFSDDVASLTGRWRRHRRVAHVRQPMAEIGHSSGGDATPSELGRLFRDPG